MRELTFARRCWIHALGGVRPERVALTVATSIGAAQGHVVAPDAVRSPSALGRAMAYLTADPEGRFGAVVLIVLVMVGVLAPIIAPYDPIQVAVGPPLTGPSSAYWLGTDDLGRDVLSRLVHGARISLNVSVLSAAGALVVAVSLG